MSQSPSPLPIEIGPAQPTDATDIRRIRDAGWIATYAGLAGVTPAEMRERWAGQYGDRVETWEDHIATGADGRDVIVARFASEYLVGVLASKMVEDQRFITDLHVQEGARRGQVASRMLVHCQEKYADDGLYARLGRDMDHQIGMFEGLGFVQARPVPGVVKVTDTQLAFVPKVEMRWLPDAPVR